MYSIWTQHIKDDEQKESFKKDIYGAKKVLERLQTIVSEDEKTLDRDELNLKCYDSPNWDYRQAHLNGFRSCLNKYQTLLSLDQQKDNK